MAHETDITNGKQNFWRTPLSHLNFQFLVLNYIVKWVDCPRGLLISFDFQVNVCLEAMASNLTKLDKIGVKSHIFEVAEAEFDVNLTYQPIKPRSV